MCVSYRIPLAEDSAKQHQQYISWKKIKIRLWQCLKMSYQRARRCDTGLIVYWRYQVQIPDMDWYSCINILSFFLKFSLVFQVNAWTIPCNRLWLAHSTINVTSPINTFIYNSVVQNDTFLPCASPQSSVSQLHCISYRTEEWARKNGKFTSECTK